MVWGKKNSKSCFLSVGKEQELVCKKKNAEDKNSEPNKSVFFSEAVKKKIAVKNTPTASLKKTPKKNRCGGAKKVGATRYSGEKQTRGLKNQFFQPFPQRSGCPKIASTPFH